MSVSLKLVNKNTVEIDFDFSWDLVNAVKQIPGRKYDKKQQVWRIPLDEQSVRDFLLFCNEYDVEIKESVKDLINDLKKKSKEKAKEAEANKKLLEKSKSKLKKVYGLRKGMRLRPFQKIGVEYVDRNQNVIIGDQMGLGKTCQAIASIEHLEDYPCLVVCPASIKNNWKREIEKWTSRSVKIVNATDKRVDLRARFVIINYDILWKYRKKLSDWKWKSIILDESHYIKNPKAKRTKAAKKIAKGIDTKILLTGTAILNRPSELITQLDLLNKLDEEFGGWWHFTKTYCDGHRGRWGYDYSGASNLKELHDKLISTCYIRRNKQDVLKELPEKQRQIIEFDITNEKEYKKAEKDVIKYLKNKALKDEDFKKRIENYSKKRRDEAKRRKAAKVVKKAMAAEHLVRIRELKKLAARGKMGSVTQWISDFLESDEKLVVFVHHKHIANELTEKFDALKITGEVPVNDRQGIIDKFQNDPNEKLIVLNLQAGGVGITLTASSNVAFVELPWQPGLLEQAEDRCHRIGQENAVNIYFLLAKNTIEEKIFELIQSKRVVTEQINAGKTLLTEEELQNSVFEDLMYDLIHR